MTSEPPTPLSLAELGDAIDAIDADDVALIRSAWCGDMNDIWRLRLLEIIVGAVPDVAALQRWTYP